MGVHPRWPQLVFRAQLSAGRFIRSIQVMCELSNPGGTLEGFLDEQLRTAIDTRWAAARLARCFR
jgi:hypothetical protein